MVREARDITHGTNVCVWATAALHGLLCFRLSVFLSINVILTLNYKSLLLSDSSAV